MAQEFLEKLFSLEGKTAVVTGAAGGIGSEVSAALADAGALVALCDIDLAGAKRTSEGIKNSIALALDLASTASIEGVVKEALAKLGRIDILVNCAGVNKREPAFEVREETFDRIVDVNLKGLYMLSCRAAEAMKQSGAAESSILDR